MSEIQIISTQDSQYLEELVRQKLEEKGIRVTPLRIIRSSFPNGEKYYRIDVKSNFELLGKTAIYVCAITNDSEILEIVRVGNTLAQLGIKRRVFIIPYLAYSTMERAVLPGEIVTAKTTIQMLSSIGSGGNCNVFLLFDLHTAGLLHYFEGACLRIEVYGQNTLMKALPLLNFDKSTFMFASADLGRTAWVNSFARDNGTGVAFIRKTRTNNNGNVETQTQEVIGDVKGKNLIIYDDMTRSGGTLIKAAQKYLSVGALSIYVMVSHLALIDEKIIKDLIESPIKKIIATNSHPMTQNPLIQQSEKFIILDSSEEFVKCLEEILPKN